jgi:ABC-type Zn uptake system ZnuABC Zn-binding protein ZnuA
MHLPRKYLVAAFLAVGTAVVIPGCSSTEDDWKDQGGPPRVVVTFAPLYCFVKNVAGEDAGVLTLCTNLGPHDYQFNSRDIIKLRKADLFLANGLDLDDDFAIKLKNSCGNANLKFIEAATEAIPPVELRKYAAGQKDSHGHQHGEYDPHVWLGIPQAIRLVNLVRDKLKSVDADRADRYDKRADAYNEKLKKLHAEGQKALQDKKDRRLITSHDAFHYFADAFGLKIVETISPRPGIEADSRKIAKLIDVCKENKVRVIATEPQYPRGAADVLLKALRKELPDAEIIELDPLETASADDLKDPEWYERKMRDNINKLAEALR